MGGDQVGLRCRLAIGLGKSIPLAMAAVSICQHI